MSYGFTDMLAAERRRPGMFGLRTLSETIAFINGYDSGVHGALLQGFREWLQVRLGARSSYDWSSLAVYIALPDTDGPRRLTAEQEAVATDAMFELLDQFLADRSRRDGLLDTYLRFHAACDEWDARLRREPDEADESRP